MDATFETDDQELKAFLPTLEYKARRCRQYIESILAVKNQQKITRSAFSVKGQVGPAEFWPEKTRDVPTGSRHSMSRDPVETDVVVHIIRILRTAQATPRTKKKPSCKKNLTGRGTAAMFFRLQASLNQLKLQIAILPRFFGAEGEGSPAHRFQGADGDAVQQNGYILDSGSHEAVSPAAAA